MFGTLPRINNMRVIISSVIGVAVLAALTDILIAPWMLNCSLVQEDAKDTLVLMHVLFRHGDRTPDDSEVYANDPLSHNDFAPLGYGQLTKEGRLREYLIGKELNRKYKQFLGPYVFDVVAAKSTDYIRTRLSCMLVIAGLYPPTGTQLLDDHILSLPILCDYVPNHKDKVLGDPLRYSLPFKRLYEQFLLSPNGQQYYKDNKEIYDYLSLQTGWDIKSPKKVYDLYFLLTSEERLGLTLPKWTEGIWPHNITTLATDEYDAQVSSTTALQIAEGCFLEKILHDTELKINNQLPKTRKIYLYSAHEYNIAFLLKALGVFERHMPPYGAYVIVEVHKIDGIYGFKFLYQNYESSSSEAKTLKLPDCDLFCPIEKFKQIIEKYMPQTLDCEVDQ